MKERLPEEIIAARAAKEFADGDYINLGVGIPNLCSMYTLPGVDVILHAEQGLLGYGSLITEDEWQAIDPYYVDGGVRFIHSKPGMCSVDIGLSFDMIRGGHIDISVLGALEVSEKGDMATWARPSVGGTNLWAGIGGVMDLAVGAKRVIVCMSHTTKRGKPKIVSQCNYPLTAKGCVNLIVTDIAVIDVGQERLVLKETAPGWTVEEVRSLTEAELMVADDVHEMRL